MRYSVKTIRSRYLSRVAGAALIAGFAAGCSSDTSRFMSANPFSNPFNSQPEQTASVPEGTGYPARPVQSRPLAPVGSGSSYRPIAAQPLPPIGSVGTTRAAPSPQVSYNQPARSLTTGSVSANSPRVSGFAKGGWSAVGGTVIAAQEGETVRTLSNRYGVPAEAIMAVNGLGSPALQPGQQITIPVYSAANAANSAAAPRALAAQPLRMAQAPLPTRSVQSVPVRVAQAPVPPRELPARQVLAKPVLAKPTLARQAAEQPAMTAQAGDQHLVAPGETLTSIAKAYGTTRPRLAKANGIDEWTSVRIGQKLKVPGGAAVADAKPLRTKPQAVAEAAAPVEKIAANTVKPVKVKPVQTAEADPSNDAEETASLPEKPVQKVSAQREDAATQAAAADTPQFRWPVRGRVIQTFGQNSDGINISVPEGTEVKAAEGGVVAYAGNELKGYGNLVLIRHSDGYVTAYAHARDLNVKRGDTVKRGQVIATAGQTGNVTSPQLLFELRRGATPVDPRQFLSGT